MKPNPIVVAATTLLATCEDAIVEGGRQDCAYYYRQCREAGGADGACLAQLDTVTPYCSALLNTVGAPTAIEPSTPARAPTASH